MVLTEKQLDTLRHMLGINTPWTAKPEPTRDYYCASPGYAEIVELERIGAVICYRRADDFTRYDWYCCTDSGRAAAMESHKTIRYSKAKRVYWKFLDISDSLPDLTFKQFLTNPEFAETRRSDNPIGDDDGDEFKYSSECDD